MTTPAEETTVYSEQGASWWPLLWAPGLALAAYLAELAVGGPTHGFALILIGLLLLGLNAMWINARRRFLTVRVTSEALWQGRESLAVHRIAEVTGVGAPAGARVLGGGWTVPRSHQQLPIRLGDGTVVLAWARDADRLRTALGEVIVA